MQAVFSTLSSLGGGNANKSQSTQNDRTVFALASQRALIIGALNDVLGSGMNARALFWQLNFYASFHTTTMSDDFPKKSAFSDPTRCQIGSHGPEHRRMFYENQRRERRAFRKQVAVGLLKLIFVGPFILLIRRFRKSSS